MKNWFDNLESRERLIVTGGALVAIVVILWGLVWKPLVDGRAELSEQVESRSRLLIDLQRAGALSGSQQGGQPSIPGANQSILLIIDSSARTFGLAESFTQTRPNGPNEISVSFQRAQFDTLIAWLIELEATYGITVDSVSMTDAGQPGLINGQVFLTRG